MACQHVLHTQLSIDECTDRLRASASTATILPEMRGKAVIGGVKRDRFWLQPAQANIYRGEMWLPVFYGRLEAGATGTRVTGHFALSGAARATLVMSIALVGTMVTAFAIGGCARIDVKSALWMVASIAFGALWIRALRTQNKDARRKLLSFVRKTLEAKPEEQSNLIRH